MSDTIENRLIVLGAFVRSPEHESLRNALIEEISYENLEVVHKRFLSLIVGQSTSAIPIAESPPRPGKSAAQHSTSVPRVPGDGPRMHSSGTKSMFHKLSSRASR
jgi:hypothetical protein